VPKSPGWGLATPAQHAAYYEDWPALSDLLKHCRGSFSVVDTGEGLVDRNRLSQGRPPLPSVVACVRVATDCPRHSVAMVEGLARQEEQKAAEERKKKEKEAREKAALVAGASTTGFIDPGMKAITAKEAKEKERKKAAKKKAKAKKRAAAKAAAASAGVACAGAGKAGDDSDSSDYDGPEEEEDEEEPGKEHLVDSRNAPDLSVMLAARRAAREKEDREKKDKV
jgi:hypothetical protein